MTDGVVERQSTDVEAHLLDLPGRSAEIDVAVHLQFDGDAVIVLRSLDELFDRSHQAELVEEDVPLAVGDPA